MSLRVAFAGFRHGHIFSLYDLVRERGDVTIAATCEEDAATRQGLEEAGIQVSHTSYARMLDEVDCDIVACGDYYGIRGERLIGALEKGCHVIADKPLCTSLESLDRIEALSVAKGLCVGCMLDLGNHAPFVKLHRMVRGGAVGEVQSIMFWGQHPLLYGKRPMWYFEPGKHGGTINDIGIHAIDTIPWLTGREIVEVTAARWWNGTLHEHPDFQVGAAFMLRLENGAAATGDVSYLASDRHGYQMPPYWRFTISGSDGVAETSCNMPTVTLWRHDNDEVIEEPVGEGRSGAYWDDFVAGIRGASAPDALDTARVTRSARIALTAQAAADTGEFPRTL